MKPSGKTGPALPEGASSRHTAAEKGGAGLRAFVKLAEIWGLDQAQQLRLLGEPGRSTLARWREKALAREDVDLGQDRLERLSYLLGIHKSLNILYTRPELAVRWLHHANPDFSDTSPLDYMLKGGRVADLYNIRSYLDDMRGGMG